MTPFTGTFYIVVQRHSGRAIDPSKPFEAVITPEHNQVSFHQIVLDIDDGQHGTPAQIIEVDLVKGTAADITKRVIELAECVE